MDRQFYLDNGDRAWGFMLRVPNARLTAADGPVVLCMKFEIPRGTVTVNLKVGLSKKKLLIRVLDISTEYRNPEMSLCWQTPLNFGNDRANELQYAILSTVGLHPPQFTIVSISLCVTNHFTHSKPNGGLSANHSSLVRRRGLHSPSIITRICGKYFFSFFPSIG